MISAITDASRLYGITIHEGESFKQALYTSRLSDSEAELQDKIAVAVKHYPGKDLALSVYESDETSPEPFAFAVVMPAL